MVMLGMLYDTETAVGTETVGTAAVITGARLTLSTEVIAEAEAETVGVPDMVMVTLTVVKLVIQSVSIPSSSSETVADGRAVTEETGAEEMAEGSELALAEASASRLDRDEAGADDAAGVPDEAGGMEVVEAIEAKDESDDMRSDELDAAAERGSTEAEAETEAD